MKKITYKIKQFEKSEPQVGGMYYIWFNTNKGVKKDWLGITLIEMLDFFGFPDNFDFVTLIYKYSCSILPHVNFSNKLDISLVFEREEDAESLARSFIYWAENYMQEQDWKDLNKEIKNKEIY